MSLDTSYQDLAVVVPKDVSIGGNSSVDVEVKVACMNAERGVAPSQYSSWNISFDGGLRDALLATNLGTSLLSQTPIGPKNLKTVSEKHSFLQLFVWVYYDNDKQHMTSFVTKYMFDGDRQKGQEFIDTFYPMASEALKQYKNINKGGLPIPDPKDLPFPY